MAKIVIYSSSHEIIICTRRNEGKILIDYFDNGGRNIEDYDRTIVKYIAVTANLEIDSEG